jgi:hypothetical protein
MNDPRIAVAMLAAGPRPVRAGAYPTRAAWIAAAQRWIAAFMSGAPRRPSGI